MALNGATEITEATETREQKVLDGATEITEVERSSERDPLTEQVIGCAVEVHRQLGPGLFEGIYESALCVELELRGLRFQRQVAVPILYKGRPVGDFRLDLLVEDRVVVEVKAVERFEPVFEAQILTYLRACGRKVGLLINFDSRLLSAGVKRFVL